MEEEEGEGVEGKEKGKKHIEGRTGKGIGQEKGMPEKKIGEESH